ncbi:MAG: hypothetical protein GY799_28770 [Desulfobulbaceae bacterium]|nr:hypothetical protein [Desulfobulbaceae bacterium]
MSVIAWDGSHIVSDNQVTDGSVPKKVQKLFRVQRSGIIHGIGFVGDCGEGHRLVAWWRGNADEDSIPNCPETTLIVAGQGFCWCYDNGSPIPFIVQETYAAFGSGASYADSALALGKTARQAVLHAIKNDVYCGMGTTSIKL